MLLLNLRAEDSTFSFGLKWHWSVADGEDMSTTEVRTKLAGKKILVLVHGYNVTDAFDAYSRMVINMQQHQLGYDEVIGVQWPGSSLAFAFLFAQLRAGKAGKKLKQALSILEGVTTLDIEGHSLGCRVICEAIYNGLRPRLVVLAGAAIDSDAINNDTKYGLCLYHIPYIMVAHSKRDAVLRKAYTLASWDNALGLTGPEDMSKVFSNVHAVDLTEHVPEHSAYKKCDEFYHAWESAIASIRSK